MIENLLGAAGVSLVIIAIISPFWKGDDLISDDFKDDISNFLLKIDYNYSWDWNAKSAYEIFRGTFGDFPGGLHQLFVIAKFSLLIFFGGIFLTISLVVPIEGVTKSTAQIALIKTLLKPESLAILFACMMSNIVIDGITILTSYNLLKKSAKKNQSGLTFKALLAIKFTGVVLIQFIIFLIFFVFVQAFMGGFFGLGGAVGLDGNYNPHLIDRSNKTVYGLSILACLASAFLSISWIFFLELISGTTKFLKRYNLILYLQYALPISEKPIRSISIFITLTVSIAFIIINFISGVF